MLYQRPLVVVFSLLSGLGVAGRPQDAISTHPSEPMFSAVSIRQIESYKRSSGPLSTSYIFTRHEPCTYSDDKVLCQLSLQELIQEAFQRKQYAISGSKWLLDDVFVFQAVLAEKVSRNDARLMLQRALKDRFGLQSHLDKKVLPVYELVAGSSGPHLKLADPVELQKKIASEGNPPSSVISSLGHFAAVSMRLEDLGPWVERIAGLDRPVLNGTGLDDRYQFDLHWEPADDTDGSEHDTGMLRALKTQAGIVPRKSNLPIEVLVIDHVNRTPTPN